MVRSILTLSLLLLMATSAAAVDQIVPVEAIAYPSPGLQVFYVYVTPPTGATDIVGWTGRMQGGPGVRFVQMNWFHDGGVEHWLNAQNFLGNADQTKETIVNATPVMLPAGTGHKLTTNGSDLVFARFQCYMTLAVPSNCSGWATFYFRVP